MVEMHRWVSTLILFPFHALKTSASFPLIPCEKQTLIQLNFVFNLKHLAPTHFKTLAAQLQ